LTGPSPFREDGMNPQGLYTSDNFPERRGRESL